MPAEFTTEERAWLFPPKDPAFEKEVFRLTRLLRHNRRLIRDQERHVIIALAELWTREAQVRYSTKTIDLGDVVCLIDEQWTLVHWPLGFNPIAEAVKLAKDYPNTPQRTSIGGCLGDINYTVERVAFQLNLFALRNGETSFFISCHDLAPRIDSTPKTVHRALARLERAGKLAVCSRGSPATRKATTYLARFWQ